MNTQANSQPTQRGFPLEVGNLELQFQRLVSEDATPTGHQIATLAGLDPIRAKVLQWTHDGELEDIRPTEVVDLNGSIGRFIVADTDRSMLLAINGRRFEWPAKRIRVAVVRALGRVPAADGMLLERVDAPDRPLEDAEFVDLSDGRVEEFRSVRKEWLLNVQGVRLELTKPTIVVRDALVQAGFDPNQGLHIFLKVEGQPKQPMELTSVVDLRTPGIEKLRLTPKDVSNGETAVRARRDFKLLPIDEAYLNQHFDDWETVIEDGRRWLLLPMYQLPPGFNHQMARMAIEVASTYPSAELDMFYTFPALTLESGAVPPATDARQSIQGRPYQRWSRHRGKASPWNPSSDNVVTHLALVESALGVEVCQ